MLHPFHSARGAARAVRLLAVALLGAALLAGAQAEPAPAPLKVGVSTTPQIDALKI
ncbi:MetQ/NlpA family ABC transporter substrate-binding protein, partial [Paraburkholderia sp. Se-20369]|nr:MetQ/NlpA family ABC transporter substrate-binding protein [Paraburkholderia sp. Se-20369]